jgi:hypothetical protein
VYYPDLGSAIVAYNYDDNAVTKTNKVQRTGAWNLATTSNTEQSNTAQRKGGRFVTFQIMSSLFGGSADKYLPMSAINRNEDHLLPWKTLWVL